MGDIRARDIFSLILNRSPSPDEVAALSSEIERDKLSTSAAAHRLLMTREGLDEQIANAMVNHLHSIHFARILMVRTLLPAADTIIDLGGANSPLHMLGYAHPFKTMTVVDLPASERHEMYSNIELQEGRTSQGKVVVHYSDMTDLRAWADRSADLVWSGQSIEHIPQSAALKMISETRRVLRPGGWFCLDTPNGLVTSLHAATIGKTLIHPEHHIEYAPDHLQRIIRKGGFHIVDVRGIRRMPQTVATRRFDYTDFVLGEPITHDVDSAYIQYIAARKR